MLAAAFVIPALIVLGPVPSTDDARAVREYLAAVDGYAELHRRVLAALPAEAPCRGVEQLEWRRQALAADIRLARGGAREGAIFTDAIAVVLRQRLFEAVRELELTAGDVMPVMPESDIWSFRLDVNEFLPWEAGPPRWHVLFWSLPPLPHELEYRLLGTDLVLLDAGARLVVDVLRDAVREVPTLREEHIDPRPDTYDRDWCGDDLLLPDTGS